MPPSESQTNQSQQSSEKNTQPGGFSLRTAFIGVVVIAALGVVALGYAWYSTRSDKAVLERKLRELENKQKTAEVERKKGSEESRQALARTKQNEILAQSRQATNVLGKLLADVNTLNRELSDLKTSDLGRSIALHPDLVLVARRLYESELPKLAPSADAIQRLEGVRRIELQLVQNAGTAYEPDAQLAANLNEANYWASETARHLQQVRSLEEALVREAKVKIAAKPLDKNSPALQDEIKRLVEAENRKQQEIIIDRTDEAKKQAAEELAKAEAKRIIAEADVEAKRIIEGAEARIKEYESDLLKRDALRKSNEIQVKREAKRIYTEAEKKLLQDKASQPDVQAKLAPFISKGYWTTTTKNRMYTGAHEKKPLSYTDLQGFGALEPTFDGLQKLVSIGIGRDNDRPRWENIRGPSAYSWRRASEKVEFVKDAQHLLIELGPVLVEMKLLLE